MKIRKISRFVVFILTISVLAIPFFSVEAKTEDSTNELYRQNVSTDILQTENSASIDCLMTELKGMSLKEAKTAINKSDPKVVDGYLLDKAGEVSEIMSKAVTEQDEKRALDELAEKDMIIDSIEIDKDYYETKDKTVTEFTIKTINDNSLVLTLTDEEDKNKFAEALAGTIIYKEYGDRRYTAYAERSYNNLKLGAYNRIGYTIDSSHRLTKRYITVATLNEGESYGNSSKYAICKNAYCDFWALKEERGYKYIKSVGHMSYDYYMSYTGAAQYQGSLKSTLTAWVLVDQWVSGGAKMNQYCKIEEGYH
jgi:hypothetical protein